MKMQTFDQPGKTTEMDSTTNSRFVKEERSDKKCHQLTQHNEQYTYHSAANEDTIQKTKIVSACEN